MCQYQPYSSEQSRQSPCHKGVEEQQEQTLDSIQTKNIIRKLKSAKEMFMEFSSQEYWSRQPFPSLGDLPDPGIEPRSPALQSDSLPSESLGHQGRIHIRGTLCIRGAAGVVVFRKNGITIRSYAESHALAMTVIHPGAQKQRKCVL